VGWFGGFWGGEGGVGGGGGGYVLDYELFELVHMYPGQHIDIVQKQFGSTNKRYCALPHHS